MAEGPSKPNSPGPSNNEAICGREGILKALIDKAPALIGDIIDSMLGVVDSLKKVRNITEYETCSPSVSMRLGELQRFMMEVIHKGRSYCDGCRDLGKYASDEKLIKKIDSDLRNGKLDELNLYLYEIEDYLKICETRFTRVTDAGESARKEIREAGEDFEPKMDKALVAQKRKAMATDFLGNAATFFARSGVILTCFSPPAGIATIMAGIIGSVAGGSLGIDAKFSRNQTEIYTNACRSVIKLDRGLYEAMTIVDRMHQQIDDIKDSGMGINKIKKKRYNTRKFKKEAEEIKSAAERLCTHLRELKEKMGTMCESSTTLIKKLDQL